MDQELSNRLDKIEKMVSDNNRMLSRMRKAQKNAAFLRVVYWIVFIVAAVAAYRWIQPYITQISNLTHML